MGVNGLNDVENLWWCWGDSILHHMCVFTHHEHLIVDLAVKYFLMYCTHQVEEEELNWTFRLQLKNNTWRVKKKSQS